MAVEIVPGFYDTKDKGISLSIRNKDDILVVTLTGSLDTYNSDFFIRKIEKVKETNYRKIIFKMENLEYVSSTGIGAFTQILKMFNGFSPRGEVVLCEIRPKVMEIFNLLGFNTFFKILSSVDEAIFFIEKKEIPIKEVSVFPKTVQCIICSQRLKVVKYGRFRCPRCKGVLTVNVQGKIL